MSQFSNTKRLCCWAGLTPGNNESAGKKKSVRITRAGVYLKPALVQVAHASVICVDQPYYANKFRGIMKRRGKKRTIIAIARMILTAVYHIMKNGEVWNPSDLTEIDLTPEMAEKRRTRDIKRAVNLLVAEGIISAETQLSLS